MKVRVKGTAVYCVVCIDVDWSQSIMSFFSSKTDILSKIEIYKLYL